MQQRGGGQKSRWVDTHWSAVFQRRSGQREEPKQKGDGIQKLIGGLKNWTAFITFEHAVSFILLSQRQLSIILVFCF